MKGKTSKFELKGRKVLVTGAGGFIGSHLVEQLVEEGSKVRALVHYNSRNDWGNLELIPKEAVKKLDVRCGDIRDPFWIREVMEGCDAIFHLAALIGIPYSYISPAEYVSTNIMGTLNILKTAKEMKVRRVIHTSTSEVYGTAEYVPIDEKHPLKGQSPYSASKIGADKIAESFYYAFGLPVTIVRPFNTYGPRQSARAVIPTMIIQALSRSGRIYLGSLEPIRDLSYVKDIVRGFIKAVQSSAAIGQTLNIGAGEGIGIGELAKKIISLTGTSAEIKKDKTRIRPEKSEVGRLICDSKKSQKLIRWKPKYSLKEGLTETIEFFRKNRMRYKTEIYNI